MPLRSLAPFGGAFHCCTADVVDSSWDSKFSCSGAYFLFMGCPFHWFAKMQKSVTLSSAEAEYFGATLAAKEAIWLRELLG